MIEIGVFITLDAYATLPKIGVSIGVEPDRHSSQERKYDAMLP